MKRKMDFISKNPDQKSDIKRSINAVKQRIGEHPDDDYYKKFEWEDVLVGYHKLKKWLLAGFISLSYKSTNRKMYQFIDIDATEKAIKEFKKKKKDNGKKKKEEERPYRIILDVVHGPDMNRKAELKSRLDEVKSSMRKGSL